SRPLQWVPPVPCGCRSLGRGWSHTENQRPSTAPIAWSWGCEYVLRQSDRESPSRTEWPVLQREEWDEFTQGAGWARLDPCGCRYENGAWTPGPNQRVNWLRGDPASALRWACGCDYFVLAGNLAGAIQEVNRHSLIDLEGNEHARD